MCGRGQEKERQPEKSIDQESLRRIVAGILPQTGWFSDEEWAARLGEEARTFREKVKDKGIPHCKWGNRILVQAETFYEFLIREFQPQEGENGKA